MQIGAQELGVTLGPTAGRRGQIADQRLLAVRQRTQHCLHHVERFHRVHPRRAAAQFAEGLRPAQQQLG
jgi:hypothetical protein